MGRCGMASITDQIDAIKVHLNTANEDFESLYGFFSYAGKTVIDIGAEYGTTAAYFLRKGAARVYAYEINPILKQELQNNFSGNKQVVIMDRWNGERLPDADILKMDCEGCEYLLTESQLQRFKKWIIGVHRPRRNMPKVLAMEEMLRRNGGRMIANMGFEVVYTNG